MAKQGSRHKTITEVEQLGPRARLKYLMDCWGMSRRRIIGRLVKGGDYWWLQDITDTEGRVLEYPLADLPEASRLTHGQVFVAPVSVENARKLHADRYVSADFGLAAERQRKDKKNPLLIRAISQSVEMPRHIPANRIPWCDDGSIALEESVFQSYFEYVCEDKAAEVARLDQDIARHKAARGQMATQVHEKERERDRLEEHCTAARDSLNEMEQDYDAKREQRETEAREQQVALKQRHDDQARALRHEIAAIKDELAVARKQREREIGEIKSQADALRSFAKERAQSLRRLELITDAQWDALYPSIDDQDDQVPGDGPLFPEGGATEAIGHVQRYLFDLPDRIGYPWALLANFHALLETRDLIILSGLSGSGKTNLVKAYANATGNAYRVIPVKPNWTSAEDLIGFYNPLQRAYATTPFLEALFDARRDPKRLYIVCLDEMNLARVEYYFADFLSRMEDRQEPAINLYPDEEAGHVLSELRVLMQALHGLQLDPRSINLESLLGDGRTMAQLAERLGLGDGESFPQLHGRVRRMLSGAISVPPKLRIPPNVRFVGAVNMDDTTNHLSPKLLDRAHVMHFQSPLDYWQRVIEELSGTEPVAGPVRIPAWHYPERGELPPYQPGDPLVQKLTDYAQEFLAPLGIELGMRPLRQAMLYRDRLAELFEGEGVQLLALNNLLRQKVLPRFSFEGKHPARGRGKLECHEVVQRFHSRLGEDLARLSSADGDILIQADAELGAMIERAEANDGVYNYWA
mgnify:CR=1 FL=1